MLLAVAVGEGDELPEQQRVLEDPLHRFDQVGLQGGRVLLAEVPGVQELFEGAVGLGWEERKKKKKVTPALLARAMTPPGSTGRGRRRGAIKVLIAALPAADRQPHPHLPE